MLKSVYTATYRSDVQKVFDVVTDLKNSAWRSDLSRIDAEDERHFTEYTKSGFPTHFTVTRKDNGSRYEFDMENKNFTGHWTGVFTALPEGGTRIDFTEELSVKNPVMRMAARLFMPVKKMQKSYGEDLRRALKEETL